MAERLMGRDWQEESRGEKLARISKAVDVFTLVGGLVAIGFAPVAAMLQSRQVWLPIQ